MIKSKDLKLFSFFSGIGFLDLGFEKNNIDIVFVNEVSKSFINAYCYVRKIMKLSEPEYGFYNCDVNELINLKRTSVHNMMKDCRKKGKVIGYIAGPPCPDFSIGGKNRGREGENGRLSYSYIKIICQEKPDFFLFENVKGLWRTKIHRQFYNELKKILNKNNYITSERVINVIEYGVPQDRDRIILIGFSKKFLRSLDFKLSDKQIEIKDFPWTKKISYNKDEVFNLPWPKRDTFSVDTLKPKPNGIPIELTVEYWFKKNEVYNHLNAKDYFKPKKGLKKMLHIDEGDDSKKSYKRLHRWRYSPTAAYGNNEVHLHPYKARRLSVAEALAIQSLPKEFLLPEKMSLTDKFKAIGNGVPFLAAKNLAETLLYYLGVDKKC